MVKGSDRDGCLAVRGNLDGQFRERSPAKCHLASYCIVYSSPVAVPLQARDAAQSGPQGFGQDCRVVVANNACATKLFAWENVSYSRVQGP